MILSSHHYSGSLFFYDHNKLADYLLLAIATFCLLIFNLYANLIGAVLTAIVWFWQKKRAGVAATS